MVVNLRCALAEVFDSEDSFRHHFSMCALPKPLQDHYICDTTTQFALLVYCRSSNVAAGVVPQSWWYRFAARDTFSSWLYHRSLKPIVCDPVGSPLTALRNGDDRGANRFPIVWLAHADASPALVRNIRAVVSLVSEERRHLLDLHVVLYHHRSKYLQHAVTNLQLDVPRVLQKYGLLSLTVHGGNCALVGLMGTTLTSHERALVPLLQLHRYLPNDEYAVVIDGHAKNVVNEDVTHLLLTANSTDSAISFVRSARKTPIRSSVRMKEVVSQISPSLWNAWDKDSLPDMRLSVVNLRKWSSYNPEFVRFSLLWKNQIERIFSDHALATIVSFSAGTSRSYLDQSWKPVPSSPVDRYSLPPVKESALEAGVPYSHLTVVWTAGPLQWDECLHSLRSMVRSASDVVLRRTNVVIAVGWLEKALLMRFINSHPVLLADLTLLHSFSCVEVDWEAQIELEGASPPAEGPPARWMLRRLVNMNVLSGPTLLASPQLRFCRDALSLAVSVVENGENEVYEWPTTEGQSHQAVDLLLTAKVEAYVSTDGKEKHGLEAMGWRHERSTEMGAEAPKRVCMDAHSYVHETCRVDDLRCEAESTQYEPLFRNSASFPLLSEWMTRFLRRQHLLAHNIEENIYVPIWEAFFRARKSKDDTKEDPVTSPDIDEITFYRKITSAADQSHDVFLVWSCDKGQVGMVIDSMRQTIAQLDASGILDAPRVIVVVHPESWDLLVCHMFKNKNEFKRLSVGIVEADRSSFSYQLLARAGVENFHHQTLCFLSSYVPSVTGQSIVMQANVSIHGAQQLTSAGLRHPIMLGHTLTQEVGQGVANLYMGTHPIISSRFQSEVMEHLADPLFDIVVVDMKQWKYHEWPVREKNELMVGCKIVFWASKMSEYMDKRLDIFSAAFLQGLGGNQQELDFSMQWKRVLRAPPPATAASRGNVGYFVGSPPFKTPLCTGPRMADKHRGTINIAVACFHSSLDKGIETMKSAFFSSPPHIRPYLRFHLLVNVNRIDLFIRRQSWKPMVGLRIDVIKWDPPAFLDCAQIECTIAERNVRIWESVQGPLAKIQSFAVVASGTMFWNGLIPWRFGPSNTTVVYSSAQHEIVVVNKGEEVQSDWQKRLRSHNVRDVKDLSWMHVNANNRTFPPVLAGSFIITSTYGGDHLSSPLAEHVLHHNPVVTRQQPADPVSISHTPHFADVVIWSPHCLAESNWIITLRSTMEELNAGIMPVRWHIVTTDRCQDPTSQPFDCVKATAVYPHHDIQCIAIAAPKLFIHMVVDVLDHVDSAVIVQGGTVIMSSVLKMTTSLVWNESSLVMASTDGGCPPQHFMETILKGDTDWKTKEEMVRHSCNSTSIVLINLKRWRAYDISGFLLNISEGNEENGVASAILLLAARRLYGVVNDWVHVACESDDDRFNLLIADSWEYVPSQPFLSSQLRSFAPLEAQERRINRAVPHLRFPVVWISHVDDIDQLPNSMVDIIAAVRPHYRPFLRMHVILYHPNRKVLDQSVITLQAALPHLLMVDFGPLNITVHSANLRLVKVMGKFLHMHERAALSVLQLQRYLPDENRAVVIFHAKDTSVVGRDVTELLILSNMRNVTWRMVPACPDQIVDTTDSKRLPLSLKTVGPLSVDKCIIHLGVSVVNLRKWSSYNPEFVRFSLLWKNQIERIFSDHALATIVSFSAGTSRSYLDQSWKPVPSSPVDRYSLPPVNESALEAEVPYSHLTVVWTAGPLQWDECLHSLRSMVRSASDVVLRRTNVVIAVGWLEKALLMRFINSHPVLLADLTLLHSFSCVEVDWEAQIELEGASPPAEGPPARWMLRRLVDMNVLSGPTLLASPQLRFCRDALSLAVSVVENGENEVYEWPTTEGQSHQAVDLLLTAKVEADEKEKHGLEAMGWRHERSTEMGAEAPKRVCMDAHSYVHETCRVDDLRCEAESTQYEPLLSQVLAEEISAANQAQPLSAEMWLYNVTDEPADPIDIVTAIDYKYVDGFVALVHSIYESASLETTSRLRFSLLTDVPEMKSIADYLSSPRVWNNGINPRIRMKSFDPDVIMKTYRTYLESITSTYDRLKSATNFARLLFPFIFNDLEKVIYFDSDIIVQQDILSLWETDVSAIAIASIKETPEASVFFDVHHPLLVNIPLEKRGVPGNSMMVMNFTAYRYYNLSGKVQEWVEAHQSAKSPLFQCCALQPPTVLAFFDHQKWITHWRHNTGLGQSRKAPQSGVRKAWHSIEWHGPRKPWKRNGLQKELWMPFASGVSFHQFVAHEWSCRHRRYDIHRHALSPLDELLLVPFWERILSPLPSSLVASSWAGNDHNSESPVNIVISHKLWSLAFVLRTLESAWQSSSKTVRARLRFFVVMDPSKQAIFERRSAVLMVKGLQIEVVPFDMQGELPQHNHYGNDTEKTRLITIASLFPQLASFAIVSEGVQFWNGVGSSAKWRSMSPALYASNDFQVAVVLNKQTTIGRTEVTNVRALEEIDWVHVSNDDRQFRPMHREQKVLTSSPSRTEDLAHDVVVWDPECGIDSWSKTLRSLTGTMRDSHQSLRHYDIRVHLISPFGCGAASCDASISAQLPAITCHHHRIGSVSWQEMFNLLSNQQNVVFIRAGAIVVSPPISMTTSATWMEGQLNRTVLGFPDGTCSPKMLSFISRRQHLSSSDKRAFFTRVCNSTSVVAVNLKEWYKQKLWDKVGQSNQSTIDDETARVWIGGSSKAVLVREWRHLQYDQHSDPYDLWFADSLEESTAASPLSTGNDPFLKANQVVSYSTALVHHLTFTIVWLDQAANMNAVLESIAITVACIKESRFPQLDLHIVLHDSNATALFALCEEMRMRLRLLLHPFNIEQFTVHPGSSLLYRLFGTAIGRMQEPLLSYVHLQQILGDTARALVIAPGYCVTKDATEYLLRSDMKQAAWSIRRNCSIHLSELNEDALPLQKRLFKPQVLCAPDMGATIVHSRFWELFSPHEDVIELLRKNELEFRWITGTTVVETILRYAYNGHIAEFNIMFSQTHEVENAPILESFKAASRHVGTATLPAPPILMNVVWTAGPLQWDECLHSLRSMVRSASDVVLRRTNVVIAVGWLEKALLMRFINSHPVLLADLTLLHSFSCVEVDWEAQIELEGASPPAEGPPARWMLRRLVDMNVLSGPTLLASPQLRFCRDALSLAVSVVENGENEVYEWPTTEGQSHQAVDLLLTAKVEAYVSTDGKEKHGLEAMGWRHARSTEMGAEAPKRVCMDAHSYVHETCRVDDLRCEAENTQYHPLLSQQLADDILQEETAIAGLKQKDVQLHHRLVPSDAINIVNTLDYKYVDGFVALAQSIMSRASGETLERLRFHLLIDPEQSEHIISFLMNHDVWGEERPPRIRIRTFDKEELKAKFQPYFETGVTELYQRLANLAAFSRLGIDSAFPDLEKALYLDSDMVLWADIAELYDTVVTKSVACFIEDPLIERYIDINAPEVRKLNISMKGIPGNSVALFNLTEYRQHDFMTKVLEWIQIHNNSTSPLFRCCALQPPTTLAWFGHMQYFSVWNQYTGLGQIATHSDERTGVPEMKQSHILEWHGKNKPWKYHGLNKGYWMPHAPTIQFSTHVSSQLWLNRQRRYLFMVNKVFSADYLSTALLWEPLLNSGVSSSAAEEFSDVPLRFPVSSLNETSFVHYLTSVRHVSQDSNVTLVWTCNIGEAADAVNSASMSVTKLSQEERFSIVIVFVVRKEEAPELVCQLFRQRLEFDQLQVHIRLADESSIFLKKLVAAGVSDLHLQTIALLASYLPSSFGEVIVMRPVVCLYHVHRLSSNIPSPLLMHENDKAALGKRLMELWKGERPVLTKGYLPVLEQLLRPKLDFVIIPMTAWRYKAWPFSDSALNLGTKLVHWTHVLRHHLPSKDVFDAALLQSVGMNQIDMIASHWRIEHHPPTNPQPVNFVLHRTPLPSHASSCLTVGSPVEEVKVTERINIVVAIVDADKKIVSRAIRTLKSAFFTSAESVRPFMRFRLLLESRGVANFYDKYHNLLPVGMHIELMEWNPPTHLRLTVNASSQHVSVAKTLGSALDDLDSFALVAVGTRFWNGIPRNTWHRPQRLRTAVYVSPNCDVIVVDRGINRRTAWYDRIDDETTVHSSYHMYVDIRWLHMSMSDIQHASYGAGKWIVTSAYTKDIKR